MNSKTKPNSLFVPTPGTAHPVSCRVQGGRATTQRYTTLFDMKRNSAIAAALVLMLVGCTAMPSDDKMLAMNALSECAGVSVIKRIPSLTIMITSTGDYYLQVRKLVDGKVSEKGFYLKDRKTDTLRIALVDIIGSIGKSPVYIEADRDSKFQSYVTVLDRLRQLGLQEVTIVTIRECKCPNNSCAEKKGDGGIKL